MSRRKRSGVVTIRWPGCARASDAAPRRKMLGCNQHMGGLGDEAREIRIRSAGDCRVGDVGRFPVRPGPGTAGQEARRRRLCPHGKGVRLQQRHHHHGRRRDRRRYRTERDRIALGHGGGEEADLAAGEDRHRHRAAQRSHDGTLRVPAGDRGGRGRWRRVDAHREQLPRPTGSRRRAPHRPR